MENNDALQPAWTGLCAELLSQPSTGQDVPSAVTDLAKLNAELGRDVDVHYLTGLNLLLDAQDAPQSDRGRVLTEQARKELALAGPTSALFQAAKVQLLVCACYYRLGQGEYALSWCEQSYTSLAHLENQIRSAAGMSVRDWVIDGSVAIAGLATLMVGVGLAAPAFIVGRHKLKEKQAHDQLEGIYALMRPLSDVLSHWNSKLPILVPASHLVVDFKPTKPPTGGTSQTDTSPVPSSGNRHGQGAPKEASPTNTSPQPSAGYQIVRQEPLGESSESMATESYPLDNRSNLATPLQVVQEVSRTASREITFTTSSELSTSASAEVISALKGELERKVSAQIGQNFGETVTHRQTLTMTAAPGQFVTYTITWIRHVQSGQYVVKLGGRDVAVPYQAYLDLSYQVTSQVASN